MYQGGDTETGYAFKMLQASVADKASEVDYLRKRLSSMYRLVLAFCYVGTSVLVGIIAGLRQFTHQQYAISILALGTLWIIGFALLTERFDRRINAFHNDASRHL
jgi:pilus assembly protein TadC